MIGRGNKYRRILSILLALLLVLTVSVCFGQVLGKFYIRNIIKNEDPQAGEVNPGSLLSEEGAGKKKVLRLNKFNYYSIQAASYSDEESALLLGQQLAEKGIPVVVTSNSPYLVLIGFLNNSEKLLPLAESIRIDGQKAVIVKGEVNAVAFKFEAEDVMAAEKIAPFLGELSTCLNKGLLLYISMNTQDEEIKNLKPKFAVLAQDVEKLAAAGLITAKSEQSSAYSEGVSDLSKRCSQWAESLYQLEKNWQDTELIKSQQMALVLLEEYHRFIAQTN